MATQQNQQQQDGPEAEYMKKIYSGGNVTTPNGDWKGFTKDMEHRLAKMYSHAGTRCEFFEKQLIECGKRVGKNAIDVKCADEYDDFIECVTLNKTMKRFQRLQEERQKRGLPFSAAPPVDTLKLYNYKTPWYQHN
jgi:hypothetical protein